MIGNIQPPNPFVFGAVINGRPGPTEPFSLLIQKRFRETFEAIRRDISSVPEVSAAEERRFLQVRGIVWDAITRHCLGRASPSRLRTRLDECIELNAAA